MPRQLLPPKLKSMKSYDVNITQTTEEEIWNHLQSKLSEIRPLFDEAYARQNEMVGLVFDSNPYENCSWRNKPPKRIEFIEWTRGEDKWFEFTSSYYNLRGDIALCLKYCSWHETKTSEANELEYQLTKLTLDYEKEFEMYEKMRYLEAKKKWEIKDAEWIAEKKAKDDHNISHKTEESWRGVQLRIKQGYWTYDDPLEIEIKDTMDLTCKYCVKQLQEAKEREEKIRMEEEEFAKKEAEWLAYKEAERKKHLEERELYTCDCCSFKTYDSEAWDKHEDSKDHKKISELKNLFCEDCQIQCRNPVELSIHKQTRKHKLAVGEIEKQTEFFCEKCNYKTQLKQNFDKHLVTKAHREKV